jgi:hypothetical protein
VALVVSNATLAQAGAVPDFGGLIGAAIAVFTAMVMSPARTEGCEKWAHASTRDAAGFADAVQLLAAVAVAEG